LFKAPVAESHKTNSSHEPEIYWNSLESSTHNIYFKMSRVMTHVDESIMSSGHYI